MKREKVLESLLVISTGLIVLFFMIKIKWLLLVAIIIGLIGVFWNFLSEKIAWLWLKLSEGLGFITSKIILTIVFYFFLFPIAVISRFFKKQSSLQLKKENKETYFFTRNKIYTKQDFENVW